MTIASAVSRVNYTGNGSVSTYPYTFRIFQDADLLVTVTDTSGAETTLTLTTDYTVTGAGDSGGGNVVLVSNSQAWLTAGKLTSGYGLVIRRVLELTQETDIRNQGDFFPESHEDEFDKLTMVDQQQQDEIDRSVKLPESIDPASFDASIPADVTDSDSAGKAIVVNADADGFELSETSFAGADALMFRDTVYIAFADSPYTLSSSHRGKLISVDTSGGAVTVNLPAISGLDLTEAFAIVIRKQTSDANAVTIAPNGSETIDKVASSKSLAAQNQAFILTPDTDTSPDDWQSLGCREVACTGTPVGTSDTQTLTNKSLSDSTTFIVDNLDATKKFQIQCSGITTATVRTMTVPDANFTAVGTDTAQVLTNKDYDGGTASNTSRVTIPKDTLANITALTRKQATLLYASDVNKVYKDDGTNLTEVGSGSSGINYITLPDAESGLGTSQWAAYADAAASTPVDGTGGSPSSTLAADSDTTLRGTKNFLFTKGAANRQGEGFSFPFTINSADQAKVLNVSFDYIASSGMVVGSSADIAVWIYDMDNAVLIPVTPYQLQGNGSLPHKFTGTFQTNISTGGGSALQYRLIFHVATTSATAYTLRVDNVVVGPQIQLYGAPVSDWTAYTPTGGWTSNVTYSGYWRREGDSMEVQAIVNLSGLPDNTNLTVSLPSGYTIDTTKLPGGADSNLRILGRCNVLDSGTAAYNGIVGYTSTTTVQPFITLVGGTYAQDNSAQISRNLPMTFASGDAVWVYFKVPITGWSSTVLMSNDTDTRVVSMRARASTTAISSGSNGTIVFPTKAFDTHGAYNSSTGIYTIPVSGKYQITCSVNASTNQSPSSADTRLALSIVKNSSTAISKREAARTTSNFTPTAVVSGTLDLVAGDLININLDNTLGSTFTCDGSTTNTFFEVSRLSGPSAIAATETVAARYTNSAGTTLTKSANNAVPFATKDYDTHGAFVTDTFTCPISGKYRVSSNILLSSGATWAASDSLEVGVFKNGSQHSASILYVTASNTANISTSFSGVVSCVAGDTLKINVVPSKSAAGNVTMTTNAPYNWVCIERIGN